MWHGPWRNTYVMCSLTVLTDLGPENGDFLQNLCYIWSQFAVYINGWNLCLNYPFFSPIFCREKKFKILTSVPGCCTLARRARRRPTSRSWRSTCQSRGRRRCGTTGRPSSAPSATTPSWCNGPSTTSQGSRERQCSTMFDNVRHAQMFKFLFQQVTHTYIHIATYFLKHKAK
jgi:hypothetical protein